MPALDDQIDDLFDTYFYHVTTPEVWEQIREDGLRSDTNGMITVLTTNHPVIIDRYASQRFGVTDIVVIRFNPCNLGIYPQQAPDGSPLQAGGYIQEIRANMIGPLLLEKENERKIEHPLKRTSPLLNDHVK
jgi:hypothetical protein